MKYKIIKMEQSIGYINIDILPLCREATFEQIISLKVSGEIKNRTMHDIVEEIDYFILRNQNKMKEYILKTTDLIKCTIGKD